MMGLPYGEEIMIVGRTMWTQSTSVTDRRTDRQTDGQNYYHKYRATQSVARQKSVTVDCVIVVGLLSYYYGLLTD